MIQPLPEMVRACLFVCLLVVAEAVARPSARKAGVVGVHGSSPGKFVLHYFDFRARGEPIRILLQAAGADWEDKRYAYDAAKQSNGAEFEAAKAAGNFSASMGLVPMLEVYQLSGKLFKLGQSQAIERFIATKHGMMGNDEEETAQVDMIAEHLRDIGAACTSLGFCLHMGSLVGPARNRFFAGFPQGDEKKEKKAKFFKEELPMFLQKLEASLQSEKPGYAVGSQTTLADVKIFYLVEEAILEKSDEVIQWPPKIAAIAKRVAALEAIKKHRETRPASPY